MCGRLNISTDPHDLVAEFGIEADNYQFSPRFNVSPGAALPILVERVGDTGELTRRLESARWGLVPGWAKDPKIGFKAFNARAETVASKPMFRAAFAARRCVVPVTGYYEWHTVDGTKQPWLMSPASETAAGQLLMAGLFEFWKDPAADWLVSTTIITTAARGHLAQVHDRMPVMLTATEAAAWIAPQENKDHASKLLNAYQADFDPESVSRYRVDPAVGNVRNEGPELAVPLPD